MTLVWIVALCLGLFLFGLIGYSDHREGIYWTTRGDNSFCVFLLSLLLYYGSLIELIGWKNIQNSPATMIILTIIGTVKVFAWGRETGKYFARKNNGWRKRCDIVV
ncbi:MAG: hypothetical protein KGJ89_03010 [Patescibacteria group bacterium]|nr:hypothetical protein [Patescibacteria group bacterium]MDE2015480.1 hypothetical protein [Patescibacteria group bacterium]MDE2226904.1 hypothetical protein [Patescibacteria group bacterium]